MPIKQTIVSLLEDNKMPFQPVVIIGKHYHFSSVIPIVFQGGEDPACKGGIARQTEQVFGKIKTLLNDCGLSINDVYDVRILLKGSMGYFDFVSSFYSKFFAEAEVKPIGEIFAVAELPFGALIQIKFDAIKQCDQDGFDKHKASWQFGSPAKVSSQRMDNK